MKAAIRKGLTGLTYSFSSNVPVPAWDADGNKNSEDVYLKVNAAGMNPVDYKAPKAILGPVYGIDCCGTIDKTGSKAAKNGLSVGDVVIGPASGGSIAEYTITSSTKVTKLPTGWSVEEGAAIPTAYDTCITCLDEAGCLEEYKKSPNQPPIDSILVIGASGGCGLAALHLAKGMGIPRIVGICSAKNKGFCKENGATEIVAYNEENAIEDFCKKNEGLIDLIYDTASFSGGGEAYSTDSKIMKLLKQSSNDHKKPTYLVLNGSPMHWFQKLAFGKPMLDSRVSLAMTQHSAEYLSLVLELMDKAKVKPIIDSTVDFTEEGVKDGYEKLKSRRVKGKLVVKVS